MAGEVKNAIDNLIATLRQTRIRIEDLGGNVANDAGFADSYQSLATMSAAQFSNAGYKGERLEKAATPNIIDSNHLYETEVFLSGAGTTMCTVSETEIYVSIETSMPEGTYYIPAGYHTIENEDVRIYDPDGPTDVIIPQLLDEDGGIYIRKTINYDDSISYNLIFQSSHHFEEWSSSRTITIDAGQVSLRSITFPCMKIAASNAYTEQELISITVDKFKTYEKILNPIGYLINDSQYLVFDTSVNLDDLDQTIVIIGNGLKGTYSLQVGTKWE